MEKIQLYSSVIIRPGTYPGISGNQVILKQETSGAVIEIFGDQELFMIDIGSSPKDWDTVDVRREDIVRVIQD